MTESEPTLVYSPLCQTIAAEGHAFGVEIYRIEDSKWVLEVVDPTNASTVWDDYLDYDVAALEAFKKLLREEGVTAILDAPTVELPS